MLDTFRALSRSALIITPMGAQRDQGTSQQNSQEMAELGPRFLFTPDSFEALQARLSPRTSEWITPTPLINRALGVLALVGIPDNLRPPFPQGPAFIS